MFCSFHYLFIVLIVDRSFEDATGEGWIHIFGFNCFWCLIVCLCYFVFLFRLFNYVVSVLSFWPIFQGFCRRWLNQRLLLFFSFVCSLFFIRLFYYFVFMSHVVFHCSWWSTGHLRIQLARLEFTCLLLFFSYLLYVPCCLTAHSRIQPPRIEFTVCFILFFVCF